MKLLKLLLIATIGLSDKLYAADASMAERVLSHQSAFVNCIKACDDWCRHNYDRSSTYHSRGHVACERGCRIMQKQLLKASINRETKSSDPK